MTVTNPYLKKKNVSARPNKPINPPAVTPLKHEPSNQTRPKPANSFGTNSVTPTSKQVLKQPVPITARGSTVHNTGQQRNTAGGGNALKSTQLTSAIIKGTIPQGSVPKSAPNSSHLSKPNQNKAQLNAKPISLKSQLKSQIALLKNQKKQHIQQKERARIEAQKEAERIAREVELARLQKEMEEEREMLRVERERKRQEEEAEMTQKRMERERIKEDKIRRREVGICLTQILKRVDSRLGWEKKSGISYDIGEAVEDLVREVERTNVNYAGQVGGVVSSFPQQRIMQPQSLHHVQRNGHAGPWYYHGAHLQPPVPTQSMPSNYYITKPQQPKPKPLILHSNPLGQYSPFRESHHILDKTVCMTKKVGESFGVTLRLDCSSALVPREGEVDARMNTRSDKEVSTSPSSVDGNVDTYAASSVHESNQHGKASMLALTPNLATSVEAVVKGSGAANDKPAVVPSQIIISQKPRKKRRIRVNYGVITVMTVSKATVFASEDIEQKVLSVPELKTGDIILEFNGRNVGGLTFAEACKALAATSVKDANGIIRCNLKVARRVEIKAPQRVLPVNVGVGSSILGSTKPVSLIPFVAIGNRVISGEFSSAEWQALVRSLSSIHRELATGMALQPVSLGDLLAALKNDETHKILQHRSIDILNSKLIFEGQKVKNQLAMLAESHWTTVWKLEVDADPNNENNWLFQGPLTDAKRSALRSLARPLTGCRCGSMTHEFVNDTKCVLYRNVKAFLGSDKMGSNPGGAAKAAQNKARNALEAAYIERFMKLRAETEAAKAEAEFVLNMEIKQSSEMNKAVFAPTSLCTMVLSAVAWMMEGETDDDKLSVRESSGEDETNDDKDSDDVGDGDNDDSDEEEDLPLNLLASSTKKISHITKKNTPSTYVLAKVLLHISRTYGHLFQEPSHVEYAW